MGTIFLWDWWSTSPPFCFGRNIRSKIFLNCHLLGAFCRSLETSSPNDIFLPAKKSWTPTLDAYFTSVHGISIYGFLGVRRSRGGGCLWVNSGNSWRSKIQIVILSILFLPNIKFKIRNLHSPLVSIFSYKPIHSITRQRPNASWLQKNARDRWIRKEGGTWRCCRKWNWKVFWEVTALMIWTAPRWWVALASNLWRFFGLCDFFLGETGTAVGSLGGSDLMVWQWLVSWKNYHGN